MPGFLFFPYLIPHCNHKCLWRSLFKTVVGKNLQSKPGWIKRGLFLKGMDTLFVKIKYGSQFSLGTRIVYFFQAKSVLKNALGTKYGVCIFINSCLCIISFFFFDWISYDCMWENIRAMIFLNHIWTAFTVSALYHGDHSLHGLILLIDLELHFLAVYLGIPIYITMVLNLILLRIKS